jgi:16S rRNA (guanine(527)-N(7))-methyltransferase RsmG
MEQGLISQSALTKLILFTDLILQWNPRINLTGFKTRELVEEILMGEAILAIPHLALEGKRVLDFGSGAGIPGIIWAICVPQMTLTSVEVRYKKIAFQKEVARETGVEAEFILGRFPDTVAGRVFDLIVSRAIRLSPALWDQAKGFLTQGGRMVRFVAAANQEDSGVRFALSTRSSLLVSPP